MTGESDKGAADPLIWLDAIDMTPGMLSVFSFYCRTMAKSAQATMDACIDKGDMVGAARAKGSRDAFDTLLHHAVVRSQGG